MKYSIITIIVVIGIVSIGFIFNGTTKDAFVPSDNISIAELEPEIVRITEPAIPMPPVTAQSNDIQIKTVRKLAEIKVDPVSICVGYRTLIEQYNCFADYYEKIVADSSVDYAIADLQTRYDRNDSFVVSQCHQLTHIIGRAALNRYGTVSETYKHGNSLCWSGYFHGVLEEVAFNQGSEWMLANIDGICTNIPGKEHYSFDYFNCVHGLGHGLMAIANHKLFESLESCDTLTGAWEQSSCWGGVFMENIISHGIKNYSLYLKPEDPLYPCNVVDDKYKTTCYLMQTSYMLEVTNRDFAKVFDLCEESDAYATICYQSLGRDASGTTISNVSRTKAYCLLGKNDTQQSNCIIGAVKDFISYFHSDIEAKNFCAAVPIEFQNTCFDTAEEYYKVFL
jgi:hypothetical protein